jgi:chemotaxis protein methyltransferase CheR
MNGSPNLTEVERFRGIVARRLGLYVDDSKLGLLADVLRRRAETHRQMCDTYLGRLEFLEPMGDEQGALARELTVTETYFFRNPDQFRAFIQVAVPSCMKARAAIRQVRVLAAGCASGEEAYSLAILLRENLTDPSWSFSIRAVDINPAMLEKAGHARYSAWALRETAPEVQRRWFTQEGREFLLNAAVRAEVAFEESNLVEDNPSLWKPESYDIVFCRNVLMYFTPENAQAVVTRIAHALAPGGYLFLGHAETLRGLSQDFHLLHTHGTFYYQCSTAAERADVKKVEAGRYTEDTPATPLPALVECTATWVETIRRAADRIQALTDEPLRSREPAAIARKPAWDLALSLELLGRERFDEALALVHALPPESAWDPEVLLLRAVLLTHSAQFELAETVCAALLRLDELNCGAHYLLALCREGAGDRKGAIEQDQIAVYLDPSFAMARLHLGLLARRAGEHSAACREFIQTLLLLQREDVSRLLLFGGGFGRAALMSLCRTEIVAYGGQP